MEQRMAFRIWIVAARNALNLWVCVLYLSMSIAKLLWSLCICRFIFSCLWFLQTWLLYALAFLLRLDIHSLAYFQWTNGKKNGQRTWRSIKENKKKRNSEKRTGFYSPQPITNSPSINVYTKPADAQTFLQWLCERTQKKRKSLDSESLSNFSENTMNTLMNGERRYMYIISVAHVNLHTHSHMSRRQHIYHSNERRGQSQYSKSYMTCVWYVF